MFEQLLAIHSTRVFSYCGGTQICCNRDLAVLRPLLSASCYASESFDPVFTWVSLPLFSRFTNDACAAVFANEDSLCPTCLVLSPTNVPIDYFSPQFFNDLSVWDRAIYMNNGVALPTAEHCQTWTDIAKWKGLGKVDFMAQYGKANLRPIQRCSRTRGHYPRLRSPLLEPLRMRSLLLAPSAPRRASACPDPAPENTPPRIFFCNLFGAVPRRRGTTRIFGALSSSPPSPAEPPARPERFQTRIGTRGTTRVFGALSSNPRLPAEPPAPPERSQTCIGTRGALPASSKPSARPPALPAASWHRGDFQIRVASNIRAKSAAGDSLGRISSSFGNHERAVGVDGPAISLPPSTTPVFLVLLPSASLGPGFSRTVQNFSRTLSEIFFAFPLILHHLPSPSHISGPQYNFLDTISVFPTPICASAALQPPPTTLNDPRPR
ncbi:hypothetical protein B0H14DRAFT_3460508 [Mycena olivaceomarginata]|nr:hypothetical protein B0H14DRAFT_3460508 [Mycena olivaceomarginata]